MGKTLTKNYPYLDINMERGVIANKIKELETQNATSKEVTIAMKELGLQRLLQEIYIYFFFSCNKLNCEVYILVTFTTLL